MTATIRVHGVDVTLTDEGEWTADTSVGLMFAVELNRTQLGTERPGEYAPDPVLRQAERAAELLGGAVVWFDGDDIPDKDSIF